MINNHNNNVEEHIDTKSNDMNNEWVKRFIELSHVYSKRATSLVIPVKVYGINVGTALIDQGCTHVLCSRDLFNKIKGSLSYVLPEILLTNTYMKSSSGHKLPIRSGTVISIDVPSSVFIRECPVYIVDTSEQGKLPCELIIGRQGLAISGYIEMNLYHGTCRNPQTGHVIRASSVDIKREFDNSDYMPVNIINLDRRKGVEKIVPEGETVSTELERYDKDAPYIANKISIDTSKNFTYNYKHTYDHNVNVINMNTDLINKHIINKTRPRSILKTYDKYSLRINKSHLQCDKDDCDSCICGHETHAMFNSEPTKPRYVHDNSEDIIVNSLDRVNNTSNDNEVNNKENTYIEENTTAEAPASNDNINNKQATYNIPNKLNHHHIDNIISFREIPVTCNNISINDSIADYLPNHNFSLLCRLYPEKRS